MECRVRASEAGSVADVVDVLRTYADEGLVDDLTVDMWPEAVSLSERAEPHSLLEDVRRYREWAETDGVTLEPGFQRRERQTPVSDDSDPILVLPTVCLVVRVEGDIVAIAPHQTDRSTYTVADALADIEAQPRFPDSLDPSSFPRDHPVHSVQNVEPTAEEAKNR